MFREITRRQMYMQIVEQIVEAVRSERLRPGDKLPTEQELMETFNVSRSSVREALSSLKLIGLIESQVGAGHYIADVRSINTFLEQATELIYSLREVDPFEVLEARRQLEGNIAALAALNRTKEDMDSLQEILDIMMADAQKGRSSFEHDSEFHLLLARATQNSILVEMLENLHLRMSSKSWHVFKGQSLEKADKVLQYQEQHARILAAIRTQNDGAARDAMIEHINTILGSFLGDESAS